MSGARTLRDLAGPLTVPPSRRFPERRTHSNTRSAPNMTDTVRRLRGLLVAFVILLFTAGVVAAGGPSDPSAHGRDIASERSGKTVPVTEHVDEDEDDDEDEDEDQDEDVEDAEDGDHCATDPRTLEGEELAALNHGAIICWAAHQETPEGFRNHGEWVSSWAKDNRGHETSESARESHGKPDGVGKPEGAGKP